ncbi:MAG TPA: sensor histidine kinase [Pseudorhodoplanes sp.]|nr:sensor histidine kinase [Pseudorhodoplanes sp.]
MIAALLALYLAYIDRAAAESQPRSILVVTQSHGSGAFFNGIFSSFQATVNGGPSPATIYRENLEVRWSVNQVFDESLLAHLKTKYAGTPLDVVVAVGAASLRHALRMREILSSPPPIVFTLVDEPTFRTMSLPPDVTGILMNFGPTEMVRAARAIVPGLKRVAIVGDVLREQPVFRYFESEIPAATKGLDLIDLTGLPMTDLRGRISNLPDDSAILYTAIYSDGRGIRLGPAEAIQLVADAANRPIVVPAENLVGRGGTGGFVLDPSAIGERAGALALRLLAREQAATIPVRIENVVKPIFDWGQLQRWNVDISRLPLGSEIRNRPLTAWDQYSTQILATAAAFAALTFLVIALLRERHIRFAAEVTATERMSELAHINRHATAGEMSAAIAHELNQPLGAILNNAETAAILLDSSSFDVRELKTILADIRKDDERAGEIIRRLRALVSKKVVDFEHADLNAIARDALAIADIQARAQSITLHNNLSPADVPVSADSVQLQQVILNLAINAIEATNERQGAPREIVAHTALAENNTAEFRISDFGRGIPADKINRIFDPFFTTKAKGMGMGLSLSRTIIEAHGGKLWAENAIAGGAIFRFRLPLVPAPERL